MVMLNAQSAKSEDDFTGRSRPQPGRYHAAVTHAEEKASKKKMTPGLELEFQVICDGLAKDGKTQTSGQTGKSIPLFLTFVGGDDAKTKTCLDRVTRLALCLGVLQPGEAKEVDWSDAIGRELVIDIEEQVYEDESGAPKAGTQVGFMGFWSLGHKDVRDIPKDPGSPGMLALAKGPRPPATAAVAPQTSAKKSWKDVL